MEKLLVPTHPGTASVSSLALSLSSSLVVEPSVEEPLLEPASEEEEEEEGLPLEPEDESSSRCGTA